MLFFLFAAGLEMNLGVIRKHRLTIAWTSLMSVLIPFILGVGLFLLFPGLWGSHVQGNLRFSRCSWARRSPYPHYRIARS